MKNIVVRNYHPDNAGENIVRYLKIRDGYTIYYIEYPKNIVFRFLEVPHGIFDDFSKLSTQRALWNFEKSSLKPKILVKKWRKALALNPVFGWFYRVPNPSLLKSRDCSGTRKIHPGVGLFWVSEVGTIHTSKKIIRSAMFSDLKKNASLLR